MSGRSGAVSLLAAALLVALAAVAAFATLEPAPAPFGGAPGRGDALRAGLAHLRGLEMALEAFALTEGRLPRPAVDASGVEGSAAASGEAVLTGALPHAVLGLTASQAGDPWGRLPTYGVTAALTAPQGWTAGAAGALAVAWGRDPANPDQPRRLEQGLAWVLVSHGANGAGALLPSGGHLSDPAADSLEADNLGRPPDPDSARFRAAPHAPVEEAGAGAGFDDLLRAGAPPS